MVKFFTSMEILHLAVICSVLFTVNGNEVDVKAKAAVSVRPNEEADLTCTTNSDIAVCTFISPSGTSYTFFQDLKYDEGRLSYFGTDRKRECGMKIQNVMKKDNGEWRCKIVAKGAGNDAQTGSNGIILTVLEAPKSVRLSGDRVSDPLSLPPNELEKKIRCTADGGHPAPTFSWTLDGAPAQVVLGEQGMDGETAFFQEVSYTARKEDNGKLLQCVVNSEAYTGDDLAAKVNVAETTLDVQFKPTPTKELYEFYGLTVGEKYEARISFRINPAPTDLTWIMHDGVQIPQNSEDEAGKYVASYAEEESPVSGLYTAMLTINQVSEADTGSENTLKVSNLHGEAEIKFKLTLGEKPPTGENLVVSDDKTDESNSDNPEAGTGPVIAVVIIVVIIIVVVAVAVVARSQGLLCFAVPVKAGEDDKEKAVDKEEGSDTESADQTEPAKTETDGETTQTKKSLPARMTSLLSVMKKTVGGPGKKASASGPAEVEELKETEEKADGAEAGEKKDDIVYADLDKSAMSEGNISISVENEKTEYAEIQTN